MVEVTFPQNRLYRTGEIIKVVGEEGSPLLKPEILHHSTDYREINHGRVIAQTEGFGRKFLAYAVHKNDPDHIHRAIIAALSFGYLEHNVRPGSLTPFENGGNESTTFISHVKPSNPLLKINTPEHYGGTLTIQYGMDHDGKPKATEMGELMQSTRSLGEFLINDRRHTTLYDVIGVSPQNFGEFKRLTLIDHNGNVNLGPMQIPQIMMMIQLGATDAKMHDVKYVAAMLSPNFARALRMLGLKFNEVQSVSLDWERVGNPEYFYDHKNYFIDEKKIAALIPDRVTGYNGKNRPVMGEYIDYLYYLVDQAASSQDPIAAYEASKTLESISKPRAYIAKTSDMYEQTRVLSKNWRNLILKGTFNGLLSKFPNITSFRRAS